MPGVVKRSTSIDSTFPDLRSTKSIFFRSKMELVSFPFTGLKVKGCCAARWVCQLVAVG